jgi:hypothetical protein
MESILRCFLETNSRIAASNERVMLAYLRQAESYGEVDLLGAAAPPVFAEASKVPEIFEDKKDEPSKVANHKDSNSEVADKKDSSSEGQDGSMLKTIESLFKVDDSGLVHRADFFKFVKERCDLGV